MKINVRIESLRLNFHKFTKEAEITKKRANQQRKKQQIQINQNHSSAL